MNINAYVINLKERTDRLNNFKNIYYENFTSGELKIIEAEKHIKPLIGCNRSHKKCIKWAIENHLSSILIFEDDFLLHSNNSINYINEAFNHLPNDYDIALFGYYFLDNNRKPVNKYWQKINDFCALHCYLVSEKGYDKILSLREDYHLDRLIGRDNSIIKYATIKCPTRQMNGYSDNSGKETNYDDLLKKFDMI